MICLCFNEMRTDFKQARDRISGGEPKVVFEKKEKRHFIMIQQGNEF